MRASEEERDLGVIMHSIAKPSRQCVEAAKRANRILGMIKRTIVIREQDVVLRLYKSLVRPHLHISSKNAAFSLGTATDTVQTANKLELVQE